MRTCTGCAVTKPLSEFYVRKSGESAGKPVSRCKACVREAGKQRYATPEGRARIAAYARANRGRYAELHREFQLRRKFGISAAGYEALLAGQSGHCRLCRAAPKPNKRLAVDHDHVTGEVRGLLCGPCNMALGIIEGRPGWLGAVEKYLDPC